MTATDETAPSEETTVPKDASKEKEGEGEGKKKRMRKPKAASREGEGETAKERPPWPGFREARPPDSVIAPAGTERARRRDGLVLADGFSYYLCLKNCGNGGFVAGKTYVLRDGAKPHPAHFRKIQ